MKGKVLAPSLISGEDGNRYTFEISDVSNLEGRSMESLTGCEVDFEVSEKVAKNIFITGGSINMANLQGQLMANDTQSIRFKFLLAIWALFGWKSYFLYSIFRLGAWTYFIYCWVCVLCVSCAWGKTRK